MISKVRRNGNSQVVTSQAVAVPTTADPKPTRTTSFTVVQV
ncbi:hypothetical protein [Hoeflea sp.]